SRSRVIPRGHQDRSQAARGLALRPPAARAAIAYRRAARRSPARREHTEAAVNATDNFDWIVGRNWLQVGSVRIACQQCAEPTAQAKSRPADRECGWTRQAESRREQK